MKYMRTIINEQLKNLYLIGRLSFYELKNQNKNNYLGIAWEIINPLIQIMIYWFVFGTLRKRAPVIVGEIQVSFLLWLMAGFIIWVFFYQSTIDGSKSIYTRLRMLSKMNFPMSVIPSIAIVNKLYVHLSMVFITLIVFNLSGFYVTIYYLQLFYFIFASICLVYSISLITSTLSTIVRDVHMFLNSTLRMMLYLSGVLWPLSQLEELEDFPFILSVLKINPLYYLIEGYRAALFGVEWYFVTEWKSTIIFWTTVFIIFFIGTQLHIKFKRHLIDYL